MIFIARIKLPNDPVRKQAARQYVVIQENGSYIFFHTSSSILGKEERVYGDRGKINGINVNFILKGDLMTANSFSVPTFIDCQKQYKLDIGSDINLTKLNHRQGTKLLYEGIVATQKLLIENEIPIVINDIDKDEFLNLNYKLKDC